MGSIILIGKLDHINGKPMKTLRSAALQPFWIEEEKASNLTFSLRFFAVASCGIFASHNHWVLMSPSLGTYQIFYKILR